MKKLRILTGLMLVTAIAGSVMAEMPPAAQAKKPITSKTYNSLTGNKKGGINNPAGEPNPASSSFSENSPQGDNSIGVDLANNPKSATAVKSKTFYQQSKAAINNAYNYVTGAKNKKPTTAALDEAQATNELNLSGLGLDQESLSTQEAWENKLDNNIAEEKQYIANQFTKNNNRGAGNTGYTPTQAFTKSMIDRTSFNKVTGTIQNPTDKGTETITTRMNEKGDILVDTSVNGKITKTTLNGQQVVENLNPLLDRFSSSPSLSTRLSRAANSASRQFNKFTTSVYNNLPSFRRPSQAAPKSNNMNEPSLNGEGYQGANLVSTADNQVALIPGQEVRDTMTPANLSPRELNRLQVASGIPAQEKNKVLNSLSVQDLNNLQSNPSLIPSKTGGVLIGTPRSNNLNTTANNGSQTKMSVSDAFNEAFGELENQPIEIYPGSNLESKADNQIAIIPSRSASVNTPQPQSLLQRLKSENRLAGSAIKPEPYQGANLVSNANNQVAIIPGT